MADAVNATTAAPASAGSPAGPIAGPALSAGRVVSRNVVAMLVARLVVAAAGLVSLPIIYSHLGAQDFGIWVILSGLTTVIALADLGLGSAIVRQVATSVHDGQIHRMRITLGLGLVWGVGMAIAGALLILLAWPGLVSVLHLQDAAAAARWATLILMLGLLMDGVALPWRGVLEGTQRYTALAYATGAAGILAAVLAVIVMHAGGGLVWLAATATVGSGVRAVATIAIAHHYLASAAPSLARITRSDLRSIGGYGLAVQVTSASGAVNVELDRFILSANYGPAVAGGFDLGGRLVGICRLVPVFALVAFFPMAVLRTAQLGTEWLDRFTLLVTKYLTALAAVGAAVLIVCADPLIRLWLGEANRWAALNVMILAPAYAFNLAAGATGIMSRVEGRPSRETAYALLSVVINLALTWPLMHLFGARGVPLATAVGVGLGTAYFLFSYYRGTGRAVRPVVHAIWPSALAGAVAVSVGALTIRYLPDGEGRLQALMTVACRASIVMVVACAVLLLTGLVTVKDVGRVRELLGLGMTEAAVPLAPAERA